MSELVAYVGWDWADREHEVCVREAVGGEERRAVIGGTPEAVHAWAGEVRARYGGGKVGVCIETSRGAVIWALMGYDHLVLYPVNPKSAASFREAFYPSGKKDDPVDADTLCEMLAKHHDRLRRLEPADPETRALGLMSEHRRKLVQEMVRTKNRLTSALKSYYPQALELAGALDTKMACDFLERWPTLEAVQRARRTTVRSFYTTHGSRSTIVLDQRLALMDAAMAWTTDRAVIESGVIIVHTLVPVLRALLTSIEHIDREIERRYRAHAEHDLIDSFAGLGMALGPRVIALLGSDRSRLTDATQLQLLTGIAPVTVRSGGTHGTVSVHRRLKRSRFLHQTIVEWAGCSIANSAWARAFYEQQIEVGHGRYAALRALGYKWLRILFQCWKTKTHYDEATHIKALKQRGSPIASRLAA